MDDLICSVLNNYMDYRTWNFFTGMNIYLPQMMKLMLMNHMGTGGLQSFKANVILSFIYYAEETVNRDYSKS